MLIVYLLIGLGVFIFVTIRFGDLVSESPVFIASSAVCCIFFGVCFFCWPISYIETMSFYIESKAYFDDIHNRYDYSTEIERAAIYNEIAEKKAKVKRVIYWNNTIFDPYIYDGFENIQLPFEE